MTARCCAARASSIRPMRRADAARPGVRDGRIVDAVPGESWDEVIDARGCIAMAGGIDLHTHIGGGKVNLARLLMVEDHRDAANPYALPTNPLELPSCGRCAPGTLGHRLSLRRDGLHRGVRAGDGGEQRAPGPHGDGRRAGARPRRLRDARQRRAVPAAAGRRRRRRAQLRPAARLHRVDDARQQGDGREGGQPGRHLGLQVQPAQARRERAARALAGDAAPGGAHAGARAARAWRAASAAHPRQQPGRGGQHRVDAADHRCARGPAGAPDARAVPLPTAPRGRRSSRRPRCSSPRR